eukprot:scaffold250032_cov39-Tisochrysis_lutea.AAC.1
MRKAAKAGSRVTHMLFSIDGGALVGKTSEVELTQGIQYMLFRDGFPSRLRACVVRFRRDHLQELCRSSVIEKIESLPLGSVSAGVASVCVWASAPEVHSWRSAIVSFPARREGGSLSFTNFAMMAAG